MRLTLRFLVVPAILWCTFTFGQKQANIWYFGDHAGLNFNSLKPVSLDDGEIVLDGGSSVISDDDGNLLFYTDGGIVWNRHHQVMPHGTGLSGLTPGISGSQALIVPRPGDGSIFFVFTAVPDAFTASTDTAAQGFRYSIVDIRLDGGNGDVVEKNLLLFKNTTERITAIHAPNLGGIWLVGHEANNNTFRSYLITETGISSEPVISQVGVDHVSINNVKNDAQGQMKISPSGSKLGVALVGSRIVQVFDFDSSSGIISNGQTIAYKTEDVVYGLEFSSSNRFLYFASGGLQCGGGSSPILQVDLRDPSLQPLVVAKGNDRENFIAMQLGPDGRIYVTVCDFSRAPGPLLSLGAIQFPERLGEACKFTDTAVDLHGSATSLGLPNFVQSYFLFEKPVVDMPSVFTPNDTDLVNPRFVPIRLDNVNFASMTIVNRWGDRLFYTEDLETGWDGGGNSDGVYYWFVHVEGKNGEGNTLRGWVELRR